MEKQQVTTNEIDELMAYKQSIKSYSIADAEEAIKLYRQQDAASHTNQKKIKYLNDHIQRKTKIQRTLDTAGLIWLSVACIGTIALAAWLFL